MLADAAEIRREVAALFRPARRIRPSQAATQSLVDFRTGQNIDFDAAPYMVEPLDTMASREHEATVLVGPSRSSKTFSLVFGGLTYIITCDPADTTVLHMNQNEMRQFSKSDLARTIDASPDLADQLGAAAGDDNIEMKIMRNGMALRMGYPSISCVSSKTIRWIIITDADNLTGDLKIGELFPLGLKRAQTFMSSGHCVVEGNPAVDYDDPNWTPKTAHQGPPSKGLVALYNSGDRRRWYWPCPHCGEHGQALPGLASFKLLPSIDELKELVLTNDVAELAEKYAVVVCEKNGCEIRHDSKREMNLRGKWLREGQSIDRDGVITGEGLKSKRATFWVAGVMAAYQSWPSMIEQFLQAVKLYATTGDEGEIKQKLNTDFAWPHIPNAALNRRRNNHALQARCENETYEKGTVPEGVRFLTGQVDIQAGKHPRFVIQVHGVGKDRERWIIDRYALKTSKRESGKLGTDGEAIMLPLDPASYTEDWDRLKEKVINRRYPLADGSGRTMPVRFTVCDSGGKAGVTRRAYEFHRRLKAEGLDHKFRLVKGAERENAKTIDETLPDASKRLDRNSGAVGDVPVLIVNVTTIKDTVSSDVWRATTGPGYYHFPKWLPSSFFDELTVEVRTAQRWDNVAEKPNESVDLCMMGEAALIRLGADRPQFWRRPPPWAAEWPDNPEILDDGELPAPRVRRRPVRGTRNPGVSIY